MRSKFLSLLILLPLLFVLSGCGQKKAPADNQTGNEPVNSQDENDEVSMTASALEMLRGGKSLHCTFSFRDEAQGAEQSGEFYVDGKNGKFRSEIDATVSGPSPMKIKMHSISDGQYAYSWNSTNAATGFKVKLEEASNVSDADKQKTGDLDQKIDFKCRKWTVDNSMFELPADVTFTDMNQMIENLKKPVGNTGVDLCSMCDMISDAAAKSDCQKSSCR
jgi:predicted small lipoprotein YifL